MLCRRVSHDLHRRAFTIVELLIVIAVIGILIALLIPAIQMVRESARRADCANRVKQHTTALVQYENAHRRFPPGFTFYHPDPASFGPAMTMWSAFTLPYLEQKVLYDQIDVQKPWTPIWNAPPENMEALSVKLKVFQCPSSGIEFGQYDYTMDIDRVQSSYIACASGLIDRESGARPFCGMNAYGNLPESDGIFYLNSSTTLNEIRDGLSTTVLMGEALSDQYLRGKDHSENPQKVDHWYIGSREMGDYDYIAATAAALGIGESTDLSECLGSTKCRVNAIKIPDSNIDEKELGFSSEHPAGVNMGFADGHVTFINLQIDRKVWSALGTRAHGELDTDID